jgi:trehalose 6-phosphate synthase
MTAPDNQEPDLVTADSLGDLFETRRLIIAANRGPVTFDTAEDGTVIVQRGTGGLVTALTGLARYADVTWIACARTEPDAAWHAGTVSFGAGELRVNFLSPEAAAYEGYYHTIANPLLWFLQHSMWDVSRAPIIDRATWHAWDNGYVVVNQQFADAIAEQVRADKRPAIVMLQDYHLYLTARGIRERIRARRQALLLHFIHIPWPGPDYWRILPGTMRQAILDSLCAVDLLGLQTREDALNFMRTCEAYLPNVSVNYKRGRVWYRNRTTHVRDFPISIDVDALRQLADSSGVARYRSELEALIGQRQLILRIDRIEPSKNIIRGFQAYEELLEFHPEYRGHVKFLALLVPSRLDVDEYQRYLDELMAAAGRINARYGDSQWEPVRLLVGEDYPRAVAALQLYDVLLVNSIADGMNLVAKEGPIVNQHAGVLVLSERTGARQQLEAGAIVIAPCDVFATAEALHQALTMPALRREELAARLRWVIEREDLQAWLHQQLQAARELNL